MADKLEVANIRLALVELIYRHDKSADELVKRAREFERYITGAADVNPRAKAQKEPVSREPSQAG